MKRALLAAATAVALAATAAPAGADFHLTTQACTEAVGRAHVGLTVADGVYTYTGELTCKGATTASITMLSIGAVTPGATTNGQSPDVPVTCVFPCAETLTASGQAPAAAGVVEVFMRISATGPTRTFTPARRAQYLYLGSGAPIVICGQGASAQCV